jgi:5,10-methylene-tetrahydrofolate dehydrogenase/methenyl tetrahydrofolate cyclohydrolase
MLSISNLKKSDIDNVDAIKEQTLIIDVGVHRNKIDFRFKYKFTTQVKETIDIYINGSLT